MGSKRDPEQAVRLASWSIPGPGIPARHTSRGWHGVIAMTAAYPCAPLASAATRRLLTRFVARRVGSGEVEDVVQATLCDALASGRAPQDEPELHRFLLAIARFKVADVHRGRRSIPLEAVEACGSSTRSPVAVAAVVALAEPAPLEERALARWAEDQLNGPAARATFEWMHREADGEKLEHIAAEAKLPAVCVRQRVSRLRRWMKARWLAELAAVAAALLLAGWARRLLVPTVPEIGPELGREAAASAARLSGSWRLVSYQPAAAIAPVRAALAEQLAKDLRLEVDGTHIRTSSSAAALSRSYLIVSISGDRVAVAPSPEQPPTEADITWEGDEVVVTAATGPWPGVARFRRAP